jgi:plastocyanin
MRRLGISLASAALVAMLAACGSAATPSPAASAPAAGSPAAGSGGASAAGGTAKACAAAPAGSTAATTVTIKNSAYGTPAVQAKVGDIVAWTNQDSIPHTATMDDGSCDTGQIAGGATAMLVFTAPGTYTYHCTVHPATMKDVTVEVK